jgi:hypothetical protein
MELIVIFIKRELSTLSNARVLKQFIRDGFSLRVVPHFSFQGDEWWFSETIAFKRKMESLIMFTSRTAVNLSSLDGFSERSGPKNANLIIVRLLTTRTHTRV